MFLLFDVDNTLTIARGKTNPRVTVYRVLQNDGNVYIAVPDIEKRIEDLIITNTKETTVPKIDFFPPIPDHLS